MHLKNTYSDILDLNIKNLLSPWLQHVGYMQDTMSMLQFRKNLLNTKIIFDLYILCAFILLQFNKITFQLLNICVWNFKLFIDHMNFWLIDWLYIYFIWLYVYIHNLSLSLSLVLTSINRFVIYRKIRDEIKSEYNKNQCYQEKKIWFVYLFWEIPC